MAFTLNWATKTILFSDIEVFGQAQILKDTPIGATAKFNNHNVKIKFTYDWYYTATYEIIINRPITELNSNTTNVPVTLNGDDSDGAVFNNVKFNCSVL